MKQPVILLLVLLFSSCAAINYRMPINKFDTPETKGAILKGEANFRYTMAHKVTLTEVYSNNFVFPIPIPLGHTVNTNARIERTFSMGLGVDLGILSRLDVFLKSDTDSPTMFGAKFQFIGEPENQKKSGLKMAIAGSGGSYKDSGRADVTQFLSTEQVTYDTTLNVDAYEASLNIGYRFNENIIAYLNNFYAEYKAEGELRKNSVLNYKIEGKSKNMGSLLGAKFGTSGFVGKIETGLSKGTWGDNNKIWTVPIGAAVGYSW